MPQRSLTKSEKRLYVGSAFLVAVPLGVGVLIHNANRDPDWLTPPARHVPNPNGYDFYLKASSAFVTFTPAVDPILDTNPPPAGTEGSRYSLARRQQWIKVNANAFGLIQQAQSLPVVNPRAPSNSMLGDQSKFRQLARFKVVEAKTYAEAGDHQRAFAAGLDTEQMGLDCARGSGSIDMLTDFAIRALGYRAIEANLTLLSPPEALAFAGRTQHLLNGANIFQQTMEAEKWQYLGILKASMQHGSWRQLSTLSQPSFSERLGLYLKTKRAIYDETVAWNDFYIQLASVGYKVSLRPPPKAPDGIAPLLSPRESFKMEQTMYLDNWSTCGC